MYEDQIQNYDPEINDEYNTTIPRPHHLCIACL